MEKKNNSKTLGYLYPKLFDHFPKDKMLQAMNRMKKETAIAVDVGNVYLTSISEVLNFNEIKYALVKYCFKIIMTIIEEEKEK